MGEEFLRTYWYLFAAIRKSYTPFFSGAFISPLCIRALPTFMMVASGHGGVFEGGSQCWITP